jgi:hypothetical protein
MTEQEALQNFATNLGMEVRERHTKDARTKTKKYYLVQTDDLCVSPVLDYENLNHFMLGWHNCLKYTLKP